MLLIARGNDTHPRPCVELITQRSKVQILPPQPILSIGCTDSKRTKKLPLTPNSRNSVVVAHGFLRFAAVQDHFHNLAVSLTLTIRHGLSINVHRGLDARVTHQLLLDGERRSSLIQPRSIAVAERMPSDIATDSGCDSSFPDVLLLNLLLMVWPPRSRIGEQPSLPG